MAEEATETRMGVVVETMQRVDAEIRRLSLRVEDLSNEIRQVLEEVAQLVSEHDGKDCHGA